MNRTLVDSPRRGRTALSAGTGVTVADEIVAAGAEALAAGNSISTPNGAEAVIDAAVETWGQVEILVRNAGRLLDRTFAKMSDDDSDSVLAVHLKGAFYLAQPAWQRMRDAGYGRIVFTSFAAGLLGNFGQDNYGAAKMALVPP